MMQNLIELERSKFEAYLIQDLQKKNNPFNKEKLLTRLPEDQTPVGGYLDPLVQERWEYWIASTQSKYENFVLMPIEPNSQILREIELLEGWTERALAARYRAMLKVAQKMFFN